MQVGAISFQPYIYNTNSLRQTSMNKVSPIPDDLLSSKTDFSELANDDLNENPLGKGQTSNFMDVLQMQFQMSLQNASRLIKPIENTEELLHNKVTEQNPAAMQKAIEAYQANMFA